MMKNAFHSGSWPTGRWKNLMASFFGLSVASGLCALPTLSPASEALVILRLPSGGIAERASVALATQTASQRAKCLGITVQAEYRAIGAFSAVMTEAQAKQLQSEPGVLYVAPDAPVYSADDLAPGVAASAPSWQDNAPWHLDRLDQKAGPLDTQFTCSYSGKGVHVFIMDSGIRATHTEFTNRLGISYNAVDGQGKAPIDEYWHGSHVAGLAAGATYGAAKSATIHPVKVTNKGGTGCAKGIIEALDWIVQQNLKPGVINMSLTMPMHFEPMEEAIRRAIRAGFPVVVAAGNTHKDAADFSPARMPEVITVGNMGRGLSGKGKLDRPAPSSNFGKCLDIWAPGLDVMSASHTDDNDAVEKQGTSMAAPVVAGVVACYLEKFPDANPEQVEKALVEGAEEGVLGNFKDGSPNKLLNTLFLDAPR